MLKTRRKDSLSWNPDHSKVRKNSFLVNFHIWQKFSFSKPLIAFFWAPIDHTTSIDKRVGNFSPIESKKSSNT